MDHREGMMTNLVGEAGINDENSPRNPNVPASSSHDLLEDEEKNDSKLSGKSEEVPTHLTCPETPVESCPKDGTVQTRHEGEEDVSDFLEAKNKEHLQHSDASNDLIECKSEESVNMKSRTPSPSLNNIITSEPNSSFYDDRSLEKSTLMVPEEVPSPFDENVVSIDNVPWACSDQFSDGSAVMAADSPLSTLESTESSPIPNDQKLKESSMEFEVTSPKMMSLTDGEHSNDKIRSMKQETSAMASSSKDAASIRQKEPKLVNGLKVDEKQKRELSMLRSSLPVKNSLLGTFKAKKKLDTDAEPSITNEKSSTLGRIVRSMNPRKAGMIPKKGLRLSPIIIKKKTSSPPKSSRLLKSKSLVIKRSSPKSDSAGSTNQSSQESSKIARNFSMSKVGDASGSNNRRMRSMKKQVEAENVDRIKDKTLHVVEHKVVGATQKLTGQKEMKLRSQQLSRTLSLKSSISSSAFLSSSCQEETDGSGSKKTHIVDRKGRTPFHVVNKQLIGSTPKSAEQKNTKLRSQLSLRILSSRSPISSSSFVSSSYEERGQEFQWTMSDSGVWKKTHFGDKNGRKPLYPEKSEQKTLQKRTENIKLKDKSSSSNSMPFRTGKEVGQQKEIHGQRRHKLMQRTISFDAKTYKGEARMKCFRKSKESTSVCSRTVCPGSPTVVLKCQDVQEKKTRALSNDVIQESAKRQLEVSKSNVEALVDAFESIIPRNERTAH